MYRPGLIAISFLACVAAVSARAQIVFEQRVGAASGVVSTGEALLTTDDQGRTWTDVTPPGATRIDGTSFADAAHGWALASGRGKPPAILRTTDGGRTWTGARFPLEGEDAATFSGQAALDFVDSRHGWALLRQTSSPNFSNGLLFATIDGGATWTRLPRPPLGEPVRFVSRTDGWQTGGPIGGRLFATHEGGHRWIAVDVPRPAGVPAGATVRYSLPQKTSGGGVIALAATYRWDTGSVVALQQSANGGDTWRATVVAQGDADANPPAVAIAGEHLVRVMAKAGTSLTGVDLAAPRPGGPIAADASVDAADFADPANGWIVTNAGRCAGYKVRCSVEQRLLSTTNGGASYDDITPEVSRPVPIVDATLGAGEGFDACSPTPSGLATWYKNSPYRYVNVYLGGSAAYCPQPGLSSAWVNTVVGQGWGLIPTWVGPQAPCTSSSGSPRFSSNPTKAAAQGAAEAQSATAKMAAIGLSGTIVYYDMEYYNDTPSCAAATKAFLNAWVQGLHGKGYVAASYGSPTNAAADWVHLTSALDAVWMALWNGKASVFNLSPLPNTAWPNHQRIHQYKGNVNQTFGGVAYNIDQDYLDGPVAK